MNVAKARNQLLSLARSAEQFQDLAQWFDENATILTTQYSISRMMLMAASDQESLKYHIKAKLAAEIGRSLLEKVVVEEFYDERTLHTRYEVRVCALGVKK